MADPVQLGKGDWSGFDAALLPVFHKAGKEWAEALRGVKKPWLCWHTDPRWCVLQQRLVLSAGWTPVVGADPRCGNLEVLPESISIDFNRGFDLPVMWLHFPLEWIFLWADRLAFWHADMVCSRQDMRALAARFEALPDGEMAAVWQHPGWRNLLRFRRHRYWEVIGCSTRGASESQYRHGAGWWRHFECHVNCPPQERELRSRYYYDSGVGIAFWRRHCGGVIRRIPDSYLAGHCTSINNPAFRIIRVEGERDLTRELALNYSLEEVARRFGVADLL